MRLNGDSMNKLTAEHRIKIRIEVEKIRSRGFSFTNLVGLLKQDSMNENEIHDYMKTFFPKSKYLRRNIQTVYPYVNKKTHR